MKNKARGTITKEIGAFIDTHEQLTADFLAQQGYDIMFIAANRRRGSKSPDIQMDRLLWEIKSPTGNSSRTIENVLRQGAKQARNVVLDLRRTERPDSKCITEAKNRFGHLKSVQFIFIITKERKLVKLQR